MLLQTIPEGLGLGALLVLVCAVGIHKGAVGMAHLYDAKVQERCVALGLTTKEKIKQNSLRFKLICVPGYLAYVLICVYAINGAQTFWGGFWQCFCNPVCDEPHRPAWHRRLLGRTHQGVGDSGNRGSDAVHLESRQADEMAVRNTGNGRDFPAPCGTRTAAVRRKYRCQRKRPNFRKEK